MKFLKKITAAIICVMITAAFSGCSDYVMTEEDLALQKSLVGFWAASDSTGYNTYDENGNLTVMIVVEFTDDFTYYLRECYVNEGYSLTYDPISYSFEDLKFKVVEDGVPSYAQVSVNEDGSKMFWITDERTDEYERVPEEAAVNLGLTVHNGENAETDAVPDISDSSSETSDNAERDIPIGDTNDT